MRIVAALLYFVAVTCVAAVALSLVSGGLKPFVSALSLLGGLGVAGWALWQEREVAFVKRKLTGWEWFGIALWSMFTLRCFLWVVFRQGDEIKVLSSNNLGDMSIHITFIRYLASGVPFWPDNPICTGAPLTYPVGTDLFNAVLLSLGVNLLIGLTWVGLVGAACTGAALWRWGGVFVLFGILCNGGFVVFEEWMQPGAKWEIRDYLDKRAWNSIPLALLVTQRGLLFALPACALLLDKWRTRFLGAPARPGWQLPQWGELLLYSTMPLFHLHAFLFLSVALGWWIISVSSARKEAFLLGIRAVIPATLLTLLVTGSFFGKGTVGIDLGWTWEAPDAEHPERPSFVVYLFKNFGALPVLLVWLLVELVRRRKDADAQTARHIAIPALAVLIACFFIRFAPWDWDNSKLIMLAYFALLPVLWTQLISRWPMPARWAICFVMFFSGFISILGGMSGKNKGHGIGAISKMDAIASAIHEIPTSERFATYPTWNHPLLLIGRKVAMGFPGHIFSHGIGSSVRDQKMEALMKGEPNWRELARDLNVRYIFWGEMERDNYKDSKQPWLAESARIAHGEWGDIYDLSLVMPSR
jgi:hypothetical protein